MNFPHRPLCSRNELLGLKVDDVEVWEQFLRQPFRRFHGRVDLPERERKREREAIERRKCLAKRKVVLIV